MILLIITIILQIIMFVYIFARMIKNNYQDYVYALIIEFFGIAIVFFTIVIGRQPSIIIYSIIYFLSFFLPIVMITLEVKNIHIAELKLIYSKSYIGKNKIINVIKKYPNSYIAHRKLAEYYKKNLEFDKAEDEYLKLIEIKSDEYDNYYELSCMYEENNKSEKAVQLLQKLLTIKPDYTRGSLLLGNLLYEEDKFKEAIAVYNEALKCNPKEYMIYYQMGMTYTRLNDFNSAKECYKRAATINSLQDISNLTLGQIYLLFEDYDQAEEYFYKTMNCDDDLIIANSYFYLAKIRLIQENNEQAIQYANLAIEFNPNIIKKMENDDVFIPILKDIKAGSQKQISTKLNKKEIQTLEHLGKTFNVVERLTYNYRASENNKEYTEESIEEEKI